MFGQGLKEYSRQYYWSNRLYERYARSIGESVQTVFLMCLLVEGTGPLCQRDICASLGVPKQTMSRVLRGLEDRGVMESAPSPEDGRERLFSLTADGERFAARVAGRLAAIEQECAAAAGTEDDLRWVNEYNRRYLAAFEEKINEERSVR